MTRNRRRGITLTEILISILIMGIGFASILTLFPLGLLRIREATRFSRSATLFSSADSDLNARNVLDKSSFGNSFYSPWYSATTNPWYTPAATPRSYDPWIQDTPAFKADPWDSALGFGAYRGDGPPTAAPFNNSIGFLPGPGLPVAYDPLWRYQTGLYPNGANEARFGSGIGFIRNDPHGKYSTAPSAHGLQRITNLSPYYPTNNPAANSAPGIFVSMDDPVLQPLTNDTLSPIVPDLSFPPSATTGVRAPMNDWTYTWMFTGRQGDCTKGTVFVGDIVIYENRPFGIDPTTGVVDGERVVEAIFGYTSQVKGATTASAVGYGSTANRAVLLRWPDTQVDPEIRVGNWIADVTYERRADEDNQRRVLDALGNGAGASYPYQRCHWYKIAKRTEAGPGQALDGDPNGTKYREMTVWASSPLESLTLLDAGATIKGSPYHVNAALINPSVIHTYPTTIHTR